MLGSFGKSSGRSGYYNHTYFFFFFFGLSDGKYIDKKYRLKESRDPNHNNLELK